MVRTIGRSPMHVMLMHETDLAALFLPDLVAALRARGWEIVTADAAFADPINRLFPDTPSANGTLTEASPGRRACRRRAGTSATTPRSPTSCSRSVCCTRIGDGECETRPAAAGRPGLCAGGRRRFRRGSFAALMGFIAGKAPVTPLRAGPGRRRGQIFRRRGHRHRAQDRACAGAAVGRDGGLRPDGGEPQLFGRGPARDLSARADQRRRLPAAGPQAGRSGAPPATQEEIANIVYGGAWGAANLGNTDPGDGWRYRGRGAKQVTGRFNYAQAAADTGADLVADPELLADTDLGMRAGLPLLGQEEVQPARRRRRHREADQGRSTAAPTASPTARPRWRGRRRYCCSGGRRSYFGLQAPLPAPIAPP